MVTLAKLIASFIGIEKFSTAVIVYGTNTLRLCDSAV
jgi:hypothetical protein